MSLENLPYIEDLPCATFATKDELIAENARLREKLELAMEIAGRYVWYRDQVMAMWKAQGLANMPASADEFDAEIDSAMYEEMMQSHGIH